MSELPQAFPAKLTGEQNRNQYHDERGLFVSRETIVAMWREQLGWAPETEPSEHVGFSEAGGLGVMASRYLRDRNAHINEGPGEKHLDALEAMPTPAEKVWTSGGTALALQELRKVRVKYEDSAELKKQKWNRAIVGLIAVAGIVTGFLGMRNSAPDSREAIPAPQILDVGVLPSDFTSETQIIVDFQEASPVTTVLATTAPAAESNPTDSGELIPATFPSAAETPIIPSVDPEGDDAVITFDINAWPLSNAENVGKEGQEAYAFVQEVLDTYNLENASNFKWNHETGMFEDGGHIMDPSQLHAYNMVMQHELAAEPEE